MKFHIIATFAAVLTAGALTSPAQATSKPTLAIMPAQFYSADAESAKQITAGLREVYERQGYDVLPMAKSSKAFQSMGLGRHKHYADRVAVKFGRRLGADLVAYPRLLAVGLPLTENRPRNLRPEAVLHLRVLNSHTGRAIYFRQVAHPFTANGSRLAGNYTLPSNAADRTAAKAASGYFNRVAGSRQEARGRH